MFDMLPLIKSGKRHITSVLLFWLTGLSTSALAQHTYYIDATGSDLNNGRSAATPFQSLNRLNNLILQPGDSILFHRGDIFRGSLQIKQSGLVGRPILIDAYGPGSNPIISGSVPITNWSTLGNNTWEAVCQPCGNRVTGVYQNDNALPLGRYPNADAPNGGYLTVQAHIGKTQLTSQQPLLTNWTGGEVVFQATPWIIDRTTISEQAGSTLTLANNPNSNYEVADLRGYFIQSHPATLDRDGEWYYNPNTKTIRLYNSQRNPNQQVITATAYAQGVSLVNVSYITLRNLQITQTMTESLYATNISNVNLINDDFTNAGEDGVIISGTGTDILVENSRIRNVNNNGFWIGDYRNVTLRGNLLRHIGVSPGRGKSGDGQYNGLHSVASLNTLIENNVIDSVGYNGVDLSYSSNVVFRQNTVSNFCLAKSDGGGVYLWNGNKIPVNNVHLLSNIIYNGIGTAEIGDTTRVGANGIFLDDCLENIDVMNNTVFNCHGYGIYLHAVSKVKATGNTSFNNSFSQFTMYDNGGICDMRGNLVKRNIFISKAAAQFVGVYASYTNDLNQYGTLDSNYYARPFADAFKIRAVYNTTIGSDLALTQWQAQFGQDKHSKDSPLTFNDYKVNALKASRVTSTFASTSEDWTNWSAYNNGRINWENTGRLDGGSLKASFPVSSTASDSYMLLTKSIGSVTRSQSFLLRFDAVASGLTHVQVFIRKRDSPYQDLDNRFDIQVGTTRKSYEFAFTASADETDALLAYQIYENGQSVNFDNIKLMEASITRVNPDEYMRLIYNPTPKDSTVLLVDNYRDVKNHYYTRRVILAPFSSIVLLKDTLPTVDVSLSLRTNKSFYRTGEVVSFVLSLSNTPGTAERVQWSCQLPASIKVISSPGIQNTGGLLTGTVQRLIKDTTFVFSIKPTTSGLYKIAAQVNASTYTDPDSTPDSGTSDGEDDAAAASFIMGGSNQQVPITLPAEPKSTHSVVVTPIPTPPIQADLSLRIELSSRTPALNELISCTIWIHNEGSVAAGTIEVQNQLPAGLQFASGKGWIANGSLLITTISNLAVGASVSLIFQAQAIATGHWINHAQINASDKVDPDSAPGNGFTNGEDDQGQADLRVQ